MEATWGYTYWPIQSLGMMLSILVPEIYALCTNVYNTQSYWVWHELDVQDGVSNVPWTAAHYLSFGLWIVTMSWLTFHYFFRRFV